MQGIIPFQYFKMGWESKSGAQFWWQEWRLVLIPSLLLERVSGSGEVIQFTGIFHVFLTVLVCFKFRGWHFLIVSKRGWRFILCSEVLWILTNWTLPPELVFIPSPCESLSVLVNSCTVSKLPQTQWLKKKKKDNHSF